mgnify:CR=1 FL=1
MASTRIGEYSSLIYSIRQNNNYHKIKKVKKTLKANKEQDHGEKKGKFGK